MKILYAEDDIDDLEFFREAIATLGAYNSVIHVSDGRDLLATLSAGMELPEVVFLDINLPLKNGYECIAEIRADARLSALPVVIFSTSSSPEVIEVMFAKGASGYVVKPVNFSHWPAVIRQALSMAPSVLENGGKPFTIL